MKLYAGSLKILVSSFCSKCLTTIIDCEMSLYFPILERRRNISEWKYYKKGCTYPSVHCIFKLLYSMAMRSQNIAETIKKSTSPRNSSAFLQVGMLYENLKFLLKSSSCKFWKTVSRVSLWKQPSPAFSLTLSIPNNDSPKHSYRVTQTSSNIAR